MSKLSHATFYKGALLSNRNTPEAQSAVRSLETGSFRGRSCWVDGHTVITSVGRKIGKHLVRHI
jgi:hypothetical protein